MKETLEKLWNDYLLDECSELDTEEERQLTRRAAELQDQVHALINKEQEEAIEKYVDAVCRMNAFLVKKAFCKGCEFAVSFLLEARNLEM